MNAPQRSTFAGRAGLRYAAMGAVTLGSLFLLMRQMRAERVLELLARVDILVVIAAFALTAVFIGVASAKLKVLVATAGGQMGLRKCARLTLATYPLNVILPSKGGDFAKSWALREMMPLSTGVGLVVLERLIDLFTLCLLAVAGSALVGHGTSLAVNLGVLALLAVMTIILSKLTPSTRLPGFLKKFGNVGSAAHSLLRMKKRLALVAAFSAIIWGGSALQVFLLYQAVGVDVPVLYCAAVTPLAVFVGFLPITIAGMGTRDSAFVYLFAAYAPSEASFAVGLLFTLCRYWGPALAGLPFLSALKLTAPPQEPPRHGTA